MTRVLMQDGHVIGQVHVDADTRELPLFAAPRKTSVTDDRAAVDFFDAMRQKGLMHQTSAQKTATSLPEPQNTGKGHMHTSCSQRTLLGASDCQNEACAWDEEPVVSEPEEEEGPMELDPLEPEAAVWDDGIPW